jgi:hypothetical protein
MLPCLPTMRTPESGGVQAILSWAPRPAGQSGITGSTFGLPWISPSWLLPGLGQAPFSFPWPRQTSAFALGPADLYFQQQLFSPKPLPGLAQLPFPNVFWAKASFAAQLSVGTQSPSAAAVLQADSTTQGFLPPRLTTTQRDAISSPPAGLLIYNTTTNKLNVYTTLWEQVTSA